MTSADGERGGRAGGGEGGLTAVGVALWGL